MPKPVPIPAEGDIEYTYEIVPTDFKEDKWVQMSEIRPSSRAACSSRRGLHPAARFQVAARRASQHSPSPPSSLSDRLFGTRLTKPPATSARLRAGQFSRSLARRHGQIHSRPFRSRIPDALHNQRAGRAPIKPASGLVFAKSKPTQRVLTLQLANDHDPMPIPPNADNYRVEVHGTLPNDRVLLSFFPAHASSRQTFRVQPVHPSPTHTVETLLRVNYDFYWQLSYRLSKPRLTQGGSRTASRSLVRQLRQQRHNPDPDSPVPGAIKPTTK